ncbi:hypothetical protein BGZ94_000917 [Podila epigama]|nr:hypothetical protein BGZ94_000917 [Podila epigama]
MATQHSTWTTDAASEGSDDTPSYAAVVHASTFDLAMGPPPSDIPQSSHIPEHPPDLPQAPGPDASATAVAPTSGLRASLVLDSDTIDIYDRSNDSFQYSLKGVVELSWTGDKELILKEATIDFLGFADTAVLRYESVMNSSTTTEMPVHHSHDFIPTPFVLAPATPRDEAVPARHNESLAIDITLPGHLPDSTNVTIGRIRYELQVNLELTFAAGTKAAVTESLVLRKPIQVHRIVYPSAFLQPRTALGLDSGGVEIQVKVPRLVHCENTLLAVDISAKPRTSKVRLKKAKVVFEQIETDRFQRTTPAIALPRAIPLVAAVVPSQANLNDTPQQDQQQHQSLHLIQQQQQQQQPPLQQLQHQKQQPQQPQQSQQRNLGPPPLPRLLTMRISRLLEIDFKEPSTELEPQTLHLQLVLSPDMCVDIQSNWLQVSHTLRVEIEYSTDEEDEANMGMSSIQEEDKKPIKALEGSLEMPDRTLDNLDAQEGTEVLQEYDDIEHGDILDANGKLKYSVDDKTEHVGSSDNVTSGPSNLSTPTNLELAIMESENTAIDPGHTLHPPSATETSFEGDETGEARPTSTGTTVSQYAVATEEIPIRVVRVVSTGLVDATTIAQAAGETEAGLPTYESVIEATGLPAYAEEKPEDDHEEAEASGTATGVLGGAARRLEGDDA